MLTFKKVSMHFCSSLLISTLSVACGPKVEETKEILSGSKPADSQGKNADIQLTFAAGSTATALKLAAGMDLGSGVILSDARINIGKIKIKPTVELEESEIEQKKEIAALKEEKEEQLKKQEETWEESKKSIEKKYEELLDSAAKESEKRTLESAAKSEKAVIEASIAAAKKSAEDELESIAAEKDADLKWKGSYVYDLIANAVSPEVPTVSLLDGTYKRIEFELKPNRVLDSSDPLLNNSVYIAGSITLNSVAVPFTFSMKLSEEFKLKGNQGTSVKPDIVNALVISFQLSNWFNGINFSSAALNSDGTIVIDDATNASIFAMIKAKMKSSAKYGEDEDGDGKLEDAESDGDSEDDDKDGAGIEDKQEGVDKE